MRTIETQTSQSPSVWSKIRTDAALLVRLARMIFSYSTAGRKIRSLYRTAEARGQVVWVDDLAETARQLK